MTQPVSLLFGVHAHQPVGNFPQVLDDAHVRCYGPFLRTLHRYPEFRFSVHFSGWLLHYLAERYPEDMGLLAEMARRGQVELFGGGDTEPVLAAIPARDRVGQLQALSDRLEGTVGQRPRGAWLTERVWESGVVPALADAGVRYVTVDDYHFLCTGMAASDLRGYYTTEEDGRNLDLFPISEALRYRLPFSPAQEAVAYLESLAGGAGEAAVYFDDIEKFGIWPETYDWVYGKGWLEQFIRGVLASRRIRTMRYRDYHEASRTRGVVYLPTTSYIEMNEWTLPAAAGHRYAEMVEEAKRGGWYERDKAFLRGGIWRNFFTRYPESNWMHKRMLGLSKRVADLEPRSRKPEIMARLYEAQANDAYWHGLFGGLYLPHLRRAVYGAMVELERMLDRVQPRPPRMAADADLDGAHEIFLQNGEIQAVVRADGRAAVCELDCYALEQNFGDTLRRHPEHYHGKARQGEARAHGGEGIASAHDRMSFKHVITTQDLEVDALPRGMFLDWADGGALAQYQEQPTGEGECGARFAAVRGALTVHKHYVVAGATLTVNYRFQGKRPAAFSTRLDIAMPSCDGPAGRYVVDGRIPGGFGQPLDESEAREVLLDDEYLGGGIRLRVSPAARITGRPLHTVSQSEGGFEKIMQSATLTLEWRPGEQAGDPEVTLEIYRRSEGADE
ncbi:MAG TPA: alpha-amylase/4-alpha-glucanotransferase domain-containing protein [Burkholderiales bacterium]|nr:alpha-amylase/4-alpha-glucanotransferase domain-containing protein [Burkholderiales bacterium]